MIDDPLEATQDEGREETFGRFGWDLKRTKEEAECLNDT